MKLLKNYELTTARYTKSRINNRTRNGNKEYLLRKEYQYVVEGENWYFTKDRGFITPGVVEKEFAKGADGDTLLTIYYHKEQPEHIRSSLEPGENETTIEDAKLAFHSMTIFTGLLVFFLIRVSVSKDYR